MHQLFKEHGYRDANAVGHALEGNLHLVFSQVRRCSLCQPSFLVATSPHIHTALYMRAFTVVSGLRTIGQQRLSRSCIVAPRGGWLATQCLRIGAAGSSLVGEQVLHSDVWVPMATVLLMKRHPCP
jgi:hypothetical protein